LPNLLLKPIFDTNIFGNVSAGERRVLLRYRPPHGWPLSAVTALELLAGIGHVKLQKFHQLREQIELACQLSKGRILEEPRYLLCKEVLHVPFPPELVRPPVRTLSLYMEVVRRAKLLEEILEGRVRFPLRKQRAGFDACVVKDVLTGWMERSETFATEIYPDWRRHFEKTGQPAAP